MGKWLACSLRRPRPGRYKRHCSTRSEAKGRLLSEGAKVTQFICQEEKKRTIASLDQHTIDETMHSNTVLFMIAAATGVMSAELNLFPGHAVVRREGAARETASPSLPSINDPCLASLMSISKTLPTPGADILSALASNTEVYLRHIPH